MQPYNQPDSDINEEQVTLQVRCPECKQVRLVTICKESLEYYVRNEEGIYADILEPWCAKCLENPDENGAEQEAEAEAQWQKALRESALFEQGLFDEGLL